MRILVTGATGNIGRMVVDRLLDSDVTVRALTINPEVARLPDSVEVHKGNIRQPDSLNNLFDDVDRMYLAPCPETTSEICRMAREAGVQRIVDVSGDKDGHWGEVARAVEASGVAWTHLSPGEFMENTEIWSEQIRQSGIVRDAWANAASALICMDDIAAVAASVLVGNGHEGCEYDLTGPQCLTRAEQVREIAVGIGKDIEFVEISKQAAIDQLKPIMGEFAEWYIDGKASLIDEPHPVATAEGGVTVVEHLTGNPATPLREWARVHADRFR